MPRYRLTIEYDGTGTVGWQQQAAGLSIQGRIGEAIAAFCGETVVVAGAGRTDAGVHARGQVAHVDLTRDWPPATVMAALNFHLKPQPIVVLDCGLASPRFDARFSATQRHYRYVILNRLARPALEASRVWHVRAKLDAGSMHEAAQALVGRHDFTTFRAAGCQAKSPVKTLDYLRVAAAGQTVTIDCGARSFMHNQVRSIVGSLKLVGEGRWSAGELRAALDAADRARCGPMAPAAGLCLMRVDYPAGGDPAAHADDDRQLSYLR